MKTIRLWIHKFNLFLSVIFSKLVYNLHKPISGIAVNRNIKYAKYKGGYHKLDVYYPTNSSKLLKIFRRRNKNLIETYSASKTDPVHKLKPCIFYFHGGGWATLDKSLYETLCKRLASFGYVVFNCNYGLTPNNTLDDIVDDCGKAISFASLIASNYGGDASRIILAGDSAGGHIAAILAGLNIDGQINDFELNNRIKALLLMYGVFDLDTLQDSGHKNIDLYVHGILSKQYKKKDEIFKKYSPKNYVDKNFPPSIIISGETDKLHESQSLYFSQLLKSKKIPHDTYFVPKDNFKGFHGFMSIDGLQTNVEGLEKIQEFLSKVEGFK